MSYFMTVAGPKVDLSDLKPIELIAIEQAQPYLQQLAKPLSSQDGQPLYLIHDGVTGSSYNFIGEAEHKIWGSNSLEHTMLYYLLERFCDAHHVLRIWWASDDTTPFGSQQCHSLEDVVKVATKHMKVGADVRLRYAQHRIAD